MKFLLITKGLPAAGKSTFAKELSVFPTVNRDTIRLANNIGSKPGQTKWTKQLEKTLVVPKRNELIRFWFDVYNVVICDDTNLHDSVVEELKALATSCGATPLVIDFTQHVSIEECIERDLKREASVGKDVILKMAKDVPAYRAAGPLVIPAVWDEALPICGIVDVDGTLADMGRRNPYDETRVSQDTVRDLVARAVVAAANTVDKVFVFSGRSSGCYDDTERWIENLVLSSDKWDWQLFMRKVDDHRRDSHVKYDMYNDYIRGKWNAKFVFDDRAQVLRECWYPLFPDGRQTTIFSVGNGREF